MDALLAFSRRLLNHARAHPAAEPMSQRQAADLAYALSLLDQAEELLEQIPSPSYAVKKILAAFGGWEAAWRGCGAGLVLRIACSEDLVSCGPGV
jgi:hypothetical protein